MEGYKKRGDIIWFAFQNMAMLTFINWPQYASLASSPPISPSYILWSNFKTPVANVMLENQLCGNKALMCWFLWCKYVHHNWFHAINSLTTTLQNSWTFNNQLLRASSKGLQHSSSTNTTFWNSSSSYLASPPTFCALCLWNHHCTAVVMSRNFGFSWTWTQIWAL